MSAFCHTYAVNRPFLGGKPPGGGCSHFVLLMDYHQWLASLLACSSERKKKKEERRRKKDDLWQDSGVLRWRRRRRWRRKRDNSGQGLLTSWAPMHFFLLCDAPLPTCFSVAPLSLLYVFSVFSLQKLAFSTTYCTSDPVPLLRACTPFFFDLQFLHYVEC